MKFECHFRVHKVWFSHLVHRTPVLSHPTLDLLDPKIFWLIPILVIWTTLQRQLSNQPLCTTPRNFRHMPQGQGDFCSLHRRLQLPLGYMQTHYSILSFPSSILSLLVSSLFYSIITHLNFLNFIFVVIYGFHRKYLIRPVSWSSCICINVITRNKKSCQSTTSTVDQEGWHTEPLVISIFITFDVSCFITVWKIRSTKGPEQYGKQPNGKLFKSFQIQ